MFEIYDKPKRYQKRYKNDTKQSQKQNIFQRRSIRKENVPPRVLDKGSNKQNDVHCDGENWNRAMFSKLHGQQEKRVEGVEPMKGEYPGVSVTGRSESRKFRGWKPLSSFPRGIRVGPWASQVRSFVRRSQGWSPFYPMPRVSGARLWSEGNYRSETWTLPASRLADDATELRYREWSVWRLIRRVRSRGILSDSNGTIPPLSHRS